MNIRNYKPIIILTLFILLKINGKKVYPNDDTINERFLNRMKTYQYNSPCVRSPLNFDSSHIHKYIKKDQVSVEVCNEQRTFSRTHFHPPETFETDIKPNQCPEKIVLIQGWYRGEYSENRYKELSDAIHLNFRNGFVSEMIIFTQVLNSNFLYVHWIYY